MKTVICDPESAAVQTAEQIRRVLEKKPDAVIAMTAEVSMSGLWDRLAGLCAAGSLRFEKAAILLAGELIGTEECLSRRSALEKGLLDRIDIDRSRCFFPNEKDPSAYEETIRQLDGLDLAVLSIGENCRIGFNEPGTLFETGTRLQKLTDSTKRELSEQGFSPEQLPEQAVTMGIRTLCSADEILVLAEGENRAAAVFRMLYGRTDPYTPAAFLQIPAEVTVFLDRAAASQL